MWDAGRRIREHFFALRNESLRFFVQLWKSGDLAEVFIALRASVACHDSVCFPLQSDFFTRVAVLPIVSDRHINPPVSCLEEIAFGSLLLAHFEVFQPAQCGCFLRSKMQ